MSITTERRIPPTLAERRNLLRDVLATIHITQEMGPVELPGFGPTTWNQNVWVEVIDPARDDRENPTCQTAFCAAGYTVAMAPEQVAWRDVWSIWLLDGADVGDAYDAMVPDVNYAPDSPHYGATLRDVLRQQLTGTKPPPDAVRNNDGHPLYMSVDNWARARLGLTNEEANVLFNSDNDLDMMDEIVEEILTGQFHAYNY